MTVICNILYGGTSIFFSFDCFRLFYRRADVLLDSKQFQKALEDYNVCLDLLKVDGEDENGRGRYAEYPDAFVGGYSYSPHQSSMLNACYVCNL